MERKLIHILDELENEGKMRFDSYNVSHSKKQGEYASDYPLTYGDLLARTSLYNVMFDIERVFLHEDSRDIAARLYINAPRILRGIIDLAIGTKKPRKFEKLKQLATDFCYSVFNLDIGEANDIFYEMMDEPLFKSNKYQLVKEMADIVSWNACRPSNLYSLESVIREHCPEAETIAISGHGGYRGGFMLATQLGLKPYALRNSGYKHKDENIIVFDENTAVKMLRGKNVIAFDEDVASGNGIHRLIEAVKCFKPQSIVGATLKIVRNDKNGFPVSGPAIFSIDKNYFFQIPKYVKNDKINEFLRKIAIYPIKDMKVR